MKKMLLVLALTTASVWAENNVYREISDPTWRVTKIGPRWVIEDSKGFFVGYYVPKATPPAAAAPTAPDSNAPSASNSAPTAPSTGSTANNDSAYYDDSAYGNYNGGYGNYNGFGYNGYGNNGFYGNCRNQFGNQPNFNNPNCEPQRHEPEPPPPPPPVPVYRAFIPR